MVPNAGLDEIIVEDDVMRQLKEIVQFEKARYVCVCVWVGWGCVCVGEGGDVLLKSFKVYHL